MLWLHANGEPFPKIAKLVRVSEVSARKYFRLYEKGGVPLVETVWCHSPQSALDEYRAKIVDEFKKRPPATNKEATKRIKELTGVERKPRAVEDFMKKIGMSCKKVGAVPGKANLDEQDEFKKGIHSCLNQIGNQYKKEAATLMNTAFQNFRNYKTMTA
ncbi:MAG: helix-turn-helix domain-containing protein [Thermoguttaceae bacterium]